MKKRLILVLLAAALLLSACQAQSPAVTKQKVGAPDKGKATAVGRLVFKASNKPVDDTVTRLAPVMRQGEQAVFVIDMGNSPATRTDADGYFAFQNVDPGEYVIFVGDLGTAYTVVIDEKENAIVYKADADKITDFGTILTPVLGK